MTKIKCAVCSETIAKRLCKIRNNLMICPSCCAQIRNPDCEGCGYYAQAGKYAKEKSIKKTSQSFVMRIDPDVDEAVDQALAMVDQGKIQAGKKAISDLLETHPDIHTVQYAMGTISAMERRYDEALTYFDKAIQIFPFFVEAWFNKGGCHQKKLEVAETINAFQKVVELGDPSDDYVRNAEDLLESLERQIHAESGQTLDGFLKSKELFDEAFTAMEKGEFGKAITSFQEVVTENPKHTQSFGNMGTCYAYLGRKNEALAALNKALELDPNYEPALLNRERVTTLKEGEKLSLTQLGSVEYYKDQFVRKKSLFRRIFG